jgi:heat-inducible transcriptional repressor
MTLSPASVRNVMADLEQAGLVYAPHTSAGRLPTERGLRFFVDALMQVGDVTERDRQAIEAQVAAAGTAKSVDAVLTRSLGHAPGLDARRRRGAGGEAEHAAQTHRVRAARARTRARCAGREDGQVENRILTLPPGLPTSAFAEATNFLNARIRGRTLAEARTELERALEAGQAELDQLTQRIVAAGLASWSGGKPRSAS